MKLEFSMTSKVNPAADVKVSFDCSAEELSVIISDPVYQALGQKLVQEVSFKRSNGNRHDHNQQHAQHRGNDRVEHMRKVYEADVQCLKTADKITNQRLDILSKRVDQIFDYVTK
jgi:hypothetical protein